MRTGIKSILLYFVFVILVVSGCSSDSGDDPNDTPAETEEISVCAVSYNDIAEITLSIKDAEGNLTAVSNGDVVGSGMKALCIAVSPMREGERVYVSDGGEKRTEAVLNENGLYECPFTFYAEDYNAHPLLIQVVYENGLASKKKYVLATNTDYKAGNGSLVKNGLGIIIGEDVLSGMKESIGNLFAGALGAEEGSVVVYDFKPADNINSNGKDGVFFVDADIPTEAVLSTVIGEKLAEFLGKILDRLDLLTILNLEMDLVLNDTEEDERGLFIALEDLHIDLEALGLGKLSLPLDMSFPMAPVALDLGEMLGGLGGGDEEDLLESILSSLDLNKLLFVNAFGRPEDTTATYSALGAGLYVANSEDVKMDPDGEDYLFPEVIVDETNGKMSLDPIKPGGELNLNGEFNMGVALSMYNLNQVLEGIITGLKIPLNAAALPIPLAIPERTPGTNQILEISLNPNGLLVDMNSPEGPRMDIMDLRMEYFEGQDAKWQMSLDIVLDLGVDVRADEQGGLFLVLTLEPIKERCNTHVMKDNMGICIFDNSDFVITLFQTLSTMMAEDGETVSEDTPFSVEIPLDDFLRPDSNVNTAGTVAFDGSGNCFMNLALEGIETGSLCFISSASMW